MPVLCKRVPARVQSKRSTIDEWNLSLRGDKTRSGIVLPARELSRQLAGMKTCFSNVITTNQPLLPQNTFSPFRGILCSLSVRGPVLYALARNQNCRRRYRPELDGRKGLSPHESEGTRTGGPGSIGNVNTSLSHLPDTGIFDRRQFPISPRSVF